MSAQLSQKGKLPPAAIAGIVLLILCGISLYIRIALPYDQVFVNGSVWFKGVDPWYHMRLVDNLVHHFPHLIHYDPYIYYPDGGAWASMPFFDWLVAGSAWLVGLGSPTQHTIDVVGAYIPPVLGTLTLIPVYFIGKELFNRWVGLLSAALLALLPGEFLNRSLLGFTDHHVAESLFTTVTILFLILALKQARERNISFGHLVNRNWSVITKPLIYTLLAGIFLGIYLLTWVGGLLVVFIIFTWLVIQFIIDHLRHKSTDYLCIIGFLTFLISFIMVLPFLSRGGLTSIYHASFLVAILSPIALRGISYLLTYKAIKPAYYPLVLFGLAGIGFAVFYAINPSLFHSMFSIFFGVFIPGGAMLTVLEVHPLLFPYGSFSFQIAWFNFTTAFFISFISLGWLIYRNIKEESTDKTLFLVWSIIMLAAVLSQRRFSYYFAINAALLTGYFSWRILDFAGLKELLAPPAAVVEVVKKVKKKRKTEARAREKTLRQRRATWIRVIVAGVVVFFLVFFPNIGKAKALAQEPSLIDRAWYSSLEWLKDNSPEPFGDPDFYYELYPPRHSFKYPETAYGVLSWWDYGHWIARVAYRPANQNPGGGWRAEQTSYYFLSQDEDASSQIIDQLDSKYVIIDDAMPTTKFYAMPTWAGSSQDEFYETYYQPVQGGELKPLNLFYPAYYRSMVVRLYNFDGKAVVPEETLVISYEEKLSREGVWYKEITGSESFSTYEEAEAYISSQELGNYKIVGTDPFTSPVPLEEMTHYQLVYTSAQKWQGKPAVKIFEYVQ
ncbi:hypothetical protein ES706_01382 [subsurface metagenome]|nr:oligosaccharyl transferase, archaeosortase A system-associated [Dehalococcoidia bacterium]